MSKFFSGASGKTVEVNQRGIMADIELAGAAYEGKRVSRAEMLLDQENDENSGESAEDEDEDGESQLSESSSESVEMQGGLRADGLDQASESDEDRQRNKQLLKQLEKAEGDSDAELDQALDMVLEAKQEESKQTKTRQASDFEKAEAIQTQRKVFNTILQQRILV